MSSSGGRINRRNYKPSVEGLESLRLLSTGAALPAAFPVSPEFAPSSTAPLDTPLSTETGFTEFGPLDTETAAPLVPGTLDGGLTWDTALGETQILELLGLAVPPSIGTDPNSINVGLSRESLLTDSASLDQGFSQMSRYLSKAWSRAGIAPQRHEDCTQSVYLTLLQTHGRPGFDSFVSEIGQSGIRDLLQRDPVLGLDFFRAVDRVKKAAQRERVHQSLDDPDWIAQAPSEVLDSWRSSLTEAMRQTLSGREQALIHASLNGETPAEIASQWGVAPKTVSNEKAKAIQKLREALFDVDDPA